MEEEMRDSGEDSKTRSMVVEEVEVTLVGSETTCVRQKSVQSWLSRFRKCMGIKARLKHRC